ncbi:MAG: hypothetical protein HY880_03925 [Deltaproteobacteria bacterium]|nr:hypothetical protein [Deltaproteobacteria bacterium]
MAPTAVETFKGSLATFFSVWQFCIMQVTPFYLAFFIAGYFLVSTGRRAVDLFFVFIMALGLALGFSLVFGFLSVSSLEPGATMIRNIKTLQHYAGIFIIAAGAIFIILVFLRPSLFRVWVVLLLSPLAGIAMGLGYSPCIPPILSKLLNYAGRPDTALRGLFLLGLYGAGLGAAWTALGIVISGIMDFICSRQRPNGSRPYYITAIASLVFMVMGVLLVTGSMRSYKAFLVSFF